MNPFDLSDKQKLAFKKLEAAYKECVKKGIFFVNVYGELQGYNSKWIEGYANSDTYNYGDKGVLVANRREEGTYCFNSIDIPNEWTDDEHLIKLTKEGVKLLEDLTC